MPVYLLSKFFILKFMLSR